MLVFILYILPTKDKDKQSIGANYLTNKEKEEKRKIQSDRQNNGQTGKRRKSAI